MKKCFQCQILKPLKDYYLSRSGSALRICKNCSCKNSVENRKKRGFSDTDRNLHYKKKFGITLEQYDAMLLDQNGVCKICKQNGSRRLAVDHDHTTGEVRGLLCYNCNLAIGLCKENFTTMSRAVVYLLGGKLL